MPIEATLAGRLLTIRCVGTYSLDELRRPWQEVAAMRDLVLPIACVLDVRESESVLGRSIADMRAIADSFMQRAALTDRRLALVAEGPARFGLMRMAATWVELAGIEAKVFRDLGEAQAWALSRLPPQDEPPPR